MLHSRIRQLVLWTCLVAFGLNSAILARGVVRCEDSQGSSRLEWGCQKNGDGHCQRKTDAHPEHDQRSGPCEDTPVNSSLTAADRAAPGSPHVVLPNLLIADVELVEAHFELVVRQGSICQARIAAPPPGLATIRTIVFLV